MRAIDIYLHRPLVGVERAKGGELGLGGSVAKKVVIWRA